MSRILPNSEGPFSAEQIRPGDPYELSNGHAFFCMGTGGRGSRANLVGGSVLETDPAVEEAGVDTGYAPTAKTLRAPDVAVGNVPDEPGWVKGAPPLAVEYADTGQDEQLLEAKISDLFSAGTRLIWVVRLVGPRRVEVHETGHEMRLVHPGDELTAPGILKNPVPVEALFDRRAAHQATLRNLLQRQGYRDLDEVRYEGRSIGKTEGIAEGKAEGIAEGKAEGIAEGKAEGIAEGKAEALQDAVLAVLAARGFSLDEKRRAVLSGCRRPEVLQDWLTRAVTAASVDDVLS